MILFVFNIRNRLLNELQLRKAIAYSFNYDYLINHGKSTFLKTSSDSSSTQYRND